MPKVLRVASRAFKVANLQCGIKREAEQQVQPLNTFGNLKRGGAVEVEAPPLTFTEIRNR